MPSKYKATKGGVSLPRELRVAGVARAKALGLDSFSRYVALLIQNDLRAPDQPFVVLTPKRLLSDQ